jgi:uncharacterized protein YneF (UPF0154 family)
VQQTVVMQKQGKRYSSKKVRQVIEGIIHFRKYNFSEANVVA